MGHVLPHHWMLKNGNAFGFRRPAVSLNIQNNGQNIRRPKNKSNILQDKPIRWCLLRFDSDAYIRLQFLSAASHSMGAHAKHSVRQMTAAAAAARRRKLRRQQRPWVTSSVPEPWIQKYLPQEQGYTYMYMIDNSADLKDRSQSTTLAFPIRILDFSPG